MLKLTLKIRKIYQRCEPWFKAAEKSLMIIQSSRGNGLVTKILGAFSLTGVALKAILPEDSVEAFLQQRRLRHGSFRNIGGFICELLVDNVKPTAVFSIGLTTQLFIWDYREGTIASIFSHDAYNDGPLVTDGSDDFLTSVIRNVVWKGKSDLMLSVSPEVYSWRGSKKFRLVEMDEPDPYIGQPSPTAIANRLDRYANAPRTILLRGPTGVGKSVLARRTARLVHRGARQTLKISGSVLQNCQFDEVILLVKMMQPSVLLLDDLNLNDRKRVDEFLLLLESLRDPRCLVFVTSMTDSDLKKKQQMGDAYFPGMRPGRIDEVISIRLPDMRHREALLNYYYKLFGVPPISKNTKQIILHATKNLSGAYLAEIVRRISIHGVKNWRWEVEQVIAAAPKLGEKKSDGPPKD